MIGELDGVGDVRLLAVPQHADQCIEVRGLDEALAHIVLLQHNDGRRVGEKSFLDGEAKHSAERRKLAVHRGRLGALVAPGLSVVVDPGGSRSERERLFPPEGVPEMRE